MNIQICCLVWRAVLKYLLKIDLLCFDRQLGVQPVQTKGGAMIKLSDVKVRPQYRTRVRYRLRVLEYAWQHGPAAAGRHYGLSARTIRRWRKRWRRGGLDGLVPSYPRPRAPPRSPPALHLTPHARQEFGYGPAAPPPSPPPRQGLPLPKGTV